MPRNEGQGPEGDLPYPDSLTYRRHNLYQTAGVMPQVLERLGMQSPFDQPPARRDVPIFERHEFVDPMDAETSMEGDNRRIPERQQIASRMLVIADDENRARYDRQLIRALEAEVTLRGMLTHERTDPVADGHFRINARKDPDQFRLHCGSMENAERVQQCLREIGFDDPQIQENDRGHYIPLAVTPESFAALAAMELITPQEAVRVRQAFPAQTRVNRGSSGQ